MNLVVYVVLLAIAPLSVCADQEPFAENYFTAWSATQQPEAGSKDIEQNLSIQADVIGHQHLHYDPNVIREPQGKSQMGIYDTRTE